MIPNEMPPFSAYSELVQTGVYVANLYLAAGYHLLALGDTTKPGVLSDGRPYVHRRKTYVLGRTADVPHFDLPPRPSPEPHEESAN